MLRNKKKTIIIEIKRILPPFLKKKSEINNSNPMKMKIAVFIIKL